MKSEEQRRLTDAYLKDCFETRLASLPGSFTDERWHSTPIRESEYRQTKRAIRKALGKRRFGRVLEIGPGDGVWTPLLREHCDGPIHLVEHSEEMLRRARQRLALISDVTYEHGDFLTADPPSENELIIAIRCFEYLEDQKRALFKMRELLAPEGCIIIVTKNAELLTRRPVQVEALRSGVLSRSQMLKLIRDAGLAPDESYPAILRFQAAYRPMRLLLEAFQRIAVASRGAVPPFLFTRYVSESYLFKLRKA